MSKKARQPFLLPASAPAVIRGGSNRSSFSQCFTSQRTWKTFDIKSRFTDAGHLQISRLCQSAPYFRLSFYYFLEVGTRPSAPQILFSSSYRLQPSFSSGLPIRGLWWSHACWLSPSPTAMSSADELHSCFCLQVHTSSSGRSSNSLTGKKKKGRFFHMGIVHLWAMLKKITWKASVHGCICKAERPCSTQICSHMSE